MGLITKIVAGVFLTAASVAMAASNHVGSAPHPSATGTSLTNINLTVDACNGVNGTLDVTATGATDDGGGNDIIWFTIFDDGIEKFAQQISIPVGTTKTTTVTVSYPGGIGSSAPGIALLVGETRDNDDDELIDDFFPTVVSGCGAASVVPTMSTWTLVILAGMLGLLGLGVLVRRNRA